MKEKIKTICLILITFAILISAGFYCWSSYQKTKVEECKAAGGEWIFTKEGNKGGKCIITPSWLR